MEILNFSETSKTSCTVFFLSLLFSFFGSYWIDLLYQKVQNSDLLSFPKYITSRSVYRKPLLFLLLVSCIGRTFMIATTPVLFYWIVAIALLSFVTATDFEQYVIFDAMLLPLAVIGIFYTLHLGLPFKEHIIASLGGGLLFFLLAVITKGAIGGGDIKLIATMGLWLGIRPLIAVIMYGFIAGGVAALFLLITKQKKKNEYFAYGPYFALSGIGILLKWIHITFQG